MPKVRYVSVTFTEREAELVAAVLDAAKDTVEFIVRETDDYVIVHDSPLAHKKPAEELRRRKRVGKAAERTRAALQSLPPLPLKEPAP